MSAPDLPLWAPPSTRPQALTGPGTATRRNACPSTRDPACVVTVSRGCPGPGRPFLLSPPPGREGWSAWGDRVLGPPSTPLLPRLCWEGSGACPFHAGSPAAVTGLLDPTLPSSQPRGPHLPLCSFSSPRGHHRPSPSSCTPSRIQAAELGPFPPTHAPPSSPHPPDFVPVCSSLPLGAPIPPVLIRGTPHRRQVSLGA